MLLRILEIVYFFRIVGKLVLFLKNIKISLEILEFLKKYQIYF